MSIAYNIAFSADLLVTLKKPFFAGKKRMKFYHLFCVVVVACGLPMSIVEAEGTPTLIQIYAEINLILNLFIEYHLPFSWLCQFSTSYHLQLSL